MIDLLIAIGVVVLGYLVLRLTLVRTDDPALADPRDRAAMESRRCRCHGAARNGVARRASDRVNL